MVVKIGVDFVGLLEKDPRKPISAYLSLWYGSLAWFNSEGVRETAWRAYSEDEAMEVAVGICAALPGALARIEERFQTWHDVLVYMDKSRRDQLDPPGRVNEYRLPQPI